MKSFRAEPIQSSTRTLGTFLRSHRERLSPTDLRLASAGRRRTPGLRREEVAQLCGVSTTWYTWLEQGRPIRASPSALRRIAEALQLSRLRGYTCLRSHAVSFRTQPKHTSWKFLQVSKTWWIRCQSPFMCWIANGTPWPGIGVLRSSSGRGWLNRKNAIFFVLSF